MKLNKKEDGKLEILNEKNEPIDIESIRLALKERAKKKEK